jgi:hypothetical protein
MIGSTPLIVDARNIWRPELVVAAGLAYRGVGVGAKAATFS